MAEGGEDIDLVEDIIIRPFSTNFKTDADATKPVTGGTGVRSPLSKFQLRALPMAQAPRSSAHRTAGDACCKWSIWCWEPHWLCKLELSNRGSNETLEYDSAPTSIGALTTFGDTERIYRSTNKRQRSCTMNRWRTRGTYWKDSLIVSCVWVNRNFHLHHHGETALGDNALFSEHTVKKSWT